jgi:hypothetical protein
MDRTSLGINPSVVLEVEAINCQFDEELLLRRKITDGHASQYAGNIWAQMKRAGQGKYDSRQKTNTGKTAETIIKEFIIEKIHARNAMCKV